MTTGEKIKKLRLKKMMTQSELVGKEITRNMLSRIENDKASPSLETLKYLSEKLGVPAGYLISNEKQDAVYEKNFEIDEIKTAYASGNFEICRELCLKSLLTDDEVLLIAAEASFAVATQYFNEGRLRAACACFDEAISFEEQTIYNAVHIRAACATYFRYMREISQNLYSNVIDENSVEYYCAMGNDFCRYIYALQGVRNGHTTFARQYISKGDRNSALSLHLDAAVDIANGNYRIAASKLRQMLSVVREICRPVLYEVFCDLEICCREIKDFKGAYEYSGNKIELLQGMLSEE